MVDLRVAPAASHLTRIAQNLDTAFTSACESGIFGALSPETIDALKESAEPVTLRRCQILQQHGYPTSSVYFLTAGLVALSVPESRNGPVEVVSLGRGECVGLTELFETRRSPYQASVRVPGFAYRVDIPILRQLAPSDPSLMMTLHRALSRIATGQSYLIACHKSHSLKQRLARYLLNTSDQLGSSRIEVTHKMIGDALGVRRAGVTDQLKAFACEGIIEGQRGLVKIQDRERLSAVGCRCAAHLDAIRIPPTMS